MGNCFSVSLGLDQVFNNCLGPFCLKLRYLRKLEENIKGLHDATEKLKARHGDLSREIAKHEQSGRQQRLEEVQGWLSKAEALEIQANTQLEDSSNQIQRLCLCGLCSKNFISGYRYSEQVFKMRQDVDDHRSNSTFERLTSEIPQPKLEMRPVEPTVGQEAMFEKTWQLFMEDDIGILGLHGMGGVGKTTLLTRMNNRLKDEGGNFDLVIWIVVSKAMQIEKIQEEIGENIGFDSDEWKLRRETNKKAIDIYTALMTKNFVLFLDDIWEKVDLAKIGIPFPDTQNRCKVVFTTRSKQVCGQMRVHAELEVKCLEDKEAWDLFRMIVGDEILESDSDITNLARSVATKCKGLPLALKVIGETMASQTTVQEWRNAVNVLTRSATEFEGMIDEILPILKFSYDNLKDGKIKKCFLYCALYPEDSRIWKVPLIDCWISEGIIDETEGIQRAEDEGHMIIGTLIRASLLIVDSRTCIRIHDVVREMALWVASDMGKQKENFIVLARAKLHKMPKVNKGEYVKKMSLIDNKIKETSDSPQCNELETLFFSDNRLRSISAEFFRSMPKLCVLDLSGNYKLVRLPEEISELVSLRYLNLSTTSIKQLPVGLWKLKKLMHLNLEFTPLLGSISGISGLSSLRILKLCGSQAKIDVGVLNELRLLEYVEVLTLDIRTTSLLEDILSDPKFARCIRGLAIINVSVESPLESLFTDMHNLIHLMIVGCEDMRDMTWLLSAPNLEWITVDRCRGIKKIISKEKIDGLRGKLKMTNNLPFQRLQGLTLSQLPELESIYWTPLSFPCLRHLNVESCPKLKKLPFHSNSITSSEFRFSSRLDKEWEEGLEWEDEATRERFMLYLENSARA